VKQKLKELETSATGEVSFPASLTAKQRKMIHDIAQESYLESRSVGKPPNRFITVKKPASNKTPVDTRRFVKERFHFNGYIGLGGPFVDYIARLMKTKFLIPHEYAQKRQERDGRFNHHITIISKAELPLVFKVQPNLTQLLATIKNLPDSWEPLGVGKAVDGENECFFVVVNWKEATELRKQFGLKPKDFHITLGFKYSDIHEPAVKNETSLVYQWAK